MPEFKIHKSHVPVLVIEKGHTFMWMLIADIGNFTYRPEESQLVADRLEAAAKMVRDNA